MKKTLVLALLLAMSSALAGCVVEPAGHYRGDYNRDHDRTSGPSRSDRDGDGVPNRYDSRPDNPYRR